MALAEKGFPMSVHQLELEAGDRGQAAAASITPQTNGSHRQPQEPGENITIAAEPSTIDSHDIVIDEDGGIDL